MDNPIIDPKKFRKMMLSLYGSTTPGFNPKIDPSLGKFADKTNLRQISFGTRSKTIGTGTGSISQAKGSEPGSAMGDKTINPTNWKSLATKADNTANSVAPFASNIANAFKKIPQPVTPNLISPVSLSKPSNAVELHEIDRSIKGLNAGADQGLDSNTAASVKAANLVTGLRAKGQSYENVRNAGIGIDNEQAKINSSINMANMQKLDQDGDAKVNMAIAGARESSANVANAADKYVQIGAAKDAKVLDLQKFDVLSKMYSQSGVTSRLINQMLGKSADYKPTDEEVQGVLNNSFKKFGGGLSKMQNGGYIGGSIMHTPKLTRTRKLSKVY